MVEPAEAGARCASVDRTLDAVQRLAAIEAELAAGHLEAATAAAQALQQDLRTAENAAAVTDEASALRDRAVALWARCLDARDAAERAAEGGPIQALDLHRERWNEAMDAHGANSLEALHERAALGRAYHRCRHEYEAAEYLRPAVAGLRYLLGDSHPESVEARTWYGITMLALGEVAKGEKELRAARDTAVGLFGLSSPRTGRVFLAHADAMRRLTHPEWPVNPT